MPHRIPKEMHELLCRTVGEFVTHWAMVERCVDFCIAIVYQRAGGKRQYKELPQGHSRRIRFLRHCFNQLTAVADFADEGRSLLDRTNALTNVRHMIVHGCLSSYVSDNDEWLFVKHDISPDKQMHVSNALRTHLGENVNEAFALSTDLIDFTNRLLQTVVPEHELHELFRHP